ncbi:MAG: phage major tail tube protein [Alphaproteobacteria bacterium]|jgi:P2 family phage contractile tail tube protein|nr:phage major tail tube protein [Alphaproteobacteria bacterium]
MSLSTIPKILKDFAVYIDGTRYAGQVSEIELPKITIKKEDYRVGYMNVPITMGLEPMECTITMTEQVKGIFLLMGMLNNNSGSLVSFRGYQEGEGGLDASNSIEIQMRGVFTEYDMGTAKKGDVPSYKLKIALQQYIYKQDNVELISIDPYTNTFKVGETDQLVSSKKALGIL